MFKTGLHKDSKSQMRQIMNESAHSKENNWDKTYLSYI